MMYVMGLQNAKNRASTQEEMAEMKRLLREAMDAGACGFSAQILGETSVQRDYDGTPMITDTMAKEDLYQFGSVLSEIGRGFVQITGPSMKTSENLARASGRPIIYNAITPDVDQHGQPTPNAGKLLNWITEANEQKGLRIFGQAITSTVTTNNASHFALDIWNLFDASPPWRRITIGSPEERIQKMKDPVLRQACKDQFDNPNKPKLLNQVDRKGDTNSVGGQQDTDRDGGLGLSLRKLTYETASKEENKKWEGMTVDELAKARNQHIVDAFLDVSIEDDLHNMWKAIAKPTNLTVLKGIANDRYTFPGVSDGGAHTKFITAGDYSTDFLANLVRDNDG